eukprot:3119254-Amphidinium_carterae.1
MVMTALRERYKPKHELSCSEVSDKVRLLGRSLLKVLAGRGKGSKQCQQPLTLAAQDAESGECLSESDHENEPSSDFKLDSHLLDKANVSEQAGGWNLLKGEKGMDRPSLKAVKKANVSPMKREDVEMEISAFK